MNKNYKDTVFVCYEENAIALIKERGNCSRKFITNDIDLAKKWAFFTLSRAAEKGYYPAIGNTLDDLVEHIGEAFISMWVYYKGNIKSVKNYGICIETYALLESPTVLKQMF